MIGPRIKREAVYLHRVVIEAPPGIEVDHKNGNGLDNRRENLRLATSRENKYNRTKGRNNTSGFKGVSWYKALNKWHAQIREPGLRSKHLGYFADIVEAAEAYKKAAAELHGEFSKE